MYGRQLLERRFPLLVLLCLLAGGVTAAIDQQQVGRGIVSVIGTVRDGSELHATGAIVSISPLTGFVVTEGGLVASSETVNVTGANGVSLSAQTIRLDGRGDIAILKVNGLAGTGLIFAGAEPVAGDVVWSAFSWPTQSQLGLSRGTVRQHRTGRGAAYGSLAHAAVVGADVASVLLNDCGEVVGFSARPGGSTEPALTALAGTDLRGILDSLSIAPPVSGHTCLSECAHQGRAGRRAGPAGPGGGITRAVDGRGTGG